MIRVPAPRATYRLQLSPRFDFAAARDVTPYLADLGVSHLYLSPIFEARPGSEHGYDVVDPTRIRDELGGEDGFRSLATAARQHGMGILLDIVPNHMAVHATNPWWWDVLRSGRDSPFADWFDIDWNAGKGKLRLPILGGSLDDTITAGEWRLDRGSPHDDDEAVLRYYAHILPLKPGTFDPPVASEPFIPPATVRSIIERQSYLPMYWRDGLKAINYRRFFDISDLAVVRVERDGVFQATHALLARLVSERLIDGVRVDHVDGLLDPEGYLERLSQLLDESTPERAGRPYLVVEKILAPDERLPASWPTDGTTGYDFMNEVNRLFVDSQGHRTLLADFETRTSLPKPEETVFTAKVEAFESLFPAELDRLTAALNEIAEKTEGDPPPAIELRRALVDATAGLTVYRTYIRDDEWSRTDERRIREAFERIPSRSNEHDDRIRAIELLRTILQGRSADSKRSLAREFIGQWQRMSGPVMAKGVEDTALYRHTALTSINEVGGELDPLDDPLAAFHDANRRRLDQSPHTMVATATHDNKRGEDTRLRINVISEFADEWIASIDRWMDWHTEWRTSHPEGTAPSPADELLIYQTVLGVWPVDAKPLELVADRVADYLVKVAREAKRRSHWYEPNEAYEEALRAFARKLILAPEGQRFRDDAEPWQERMAFYGAVNSLSQVVLRLTSPGVPDLYQGTDLWDLALVDPDNRRSVDFDFRRAALQEAQGREKEGDLSSLVDEWRSNWRDGRIKLLVTSRLLRLRRVMADLFSNGSYAPLKIRGEHAERLIAFTRRRHDQWLIVIAPRLVGRLVEPGRWPVGRGVWGETTIELPDDAPSSFVDQLTDEATPPTPDRRIRVGGALRRLPAAVLADAR